MPKAELINYCSLDIETSGFDPLKAEILEVGFVMFQATGRGFKRRQTFSQVFRPAGRVHPKILGLTGISQRELDRAPRFAEFREQLQAALLDAVLVGHNIGFDRKFLESFGLKFSQPSIDTLDLAQIILPTYHSYNLQSLMHVFRVSHKQAHRALADAQAALSLLEKLLGLYQTFPQALKLQMLGVAQKANFPWAELLKEKIRPAVLPGFKPQPNNVSSKFKADLRRRTLLVWPESNYIEALARILASTPGRFLLLVPSAREVLALWRLGLAEAGFGPEESFSESKFKSLLGRKNLVPEELRFALKLLVWRFTNWQKRTVMDLNLSFAGNQYKSLVAGVKPSLPPHSAKVVCIDQQTFLRLRPPQNWRGRKLVVCGLPALEESLIAADKKYKFSWGHIEYLLKRVYNPENALGKSEFKEAVAKALSAADLFFGLAVLLLKKVNPAMGLTAWEEVAKDAFLESRLRKAAENFAEKLAIFAGSANSLEIKAAAAGIREFFQAQPGRVKWLEFGDNLCVFYNYPLDLREASKSALSKFSQLVLVDTLPHSRSANYWLWRLGLENFTAQTLAVRPRRKVSLKIGSAASLDAGTLALLKPAALPAIAVFATPLQVRAFYDAYFKQLQAFANLFAERYSGGTNKLFRNFTIEKRSILLVSEKLVLRPQVSGVLAKTAIIQAWPKPRFSHPYIQALKLFALPAFPDFEEIMAVSHLHNLLMKLDQPSLRKICVLSQVPLKSLGILSYLKSLPFIRLSKMKYYQKSPKIKGIF